MKTSKILAVAALSLLAAAGAQAETYEGVLTINSTRARAEVAGEAVATARAGNVYADGANAGVPAALSYGTDRATVRQQAVAAAHAPNQNLDRKAFVNSEVPAAYLKPTLSFTRQAAL